MTKPLHLLPTLDPEHEFARALARLRAPRLTDDPTTQARRAALAETIERAKAARAKRGKP